jgi:MoaA/NifB/PqqE/SkfB family radical SAM enzyme
MLTFRCNGGCPFCIISGRGYRQDSEELSGKQVLNWWNNLERNNGQRLSLIGGEPTMHEDIVEIVNNLENYHVTITTNCSGPFYQGEWWKKFNPKCKLRINTSYHPHLLEPEDYIEKIKLFRDNGYFVDQISYVNTPDIEKYQDKIDKVKNEIGIDYAPFLGFWNETDGYEADSCSENLHPNENYTGNIDSVKVRCGLTDLNVYREMCGQSIKKSTKCDHPFKSLIIGPDGNYYHCHYKLYYDIDPVCNINDFHGVEESDMDCRHYGYCNWCDVPRMECKPADYKEYLVKDFREDDNIDRREINHVFEYITDYDGDAVIEEYYDFICMYLYRTKKHSGKFCIKGYHKNVKDVIKRFLEDRNWKYSKTNADLNLIK